TVKDKTALLDQLAVGDEVQVTFNIRGNEYKDRFYVNLVAWKVSKTGGDSGASEGQGQASGSSMDESFDNEVDDSDEIPF
ncbi:MAG: DUF3127 domain-containing protein, partial [Verrucomicrobiota bacterium]